MIITWDEPKRLANIEKHAMDFADLTLEFFARAAIGPAKGGRLYAIGELDGVVTVIFARLGTEAISVVSMRPASVKERRSIDG
ncbi:BrnT family toxin [Methylopila turkensis]|uniref:BrnT family toxin n=1 Tax=Methylopila turkensis TaxID=1437816 RepID=A0A9W6N5Z7_9HYPH|nr:BrnT family toxin [Methylopila turkensis]GLK78791.1 hypothetical protein GCM10008174_05320 [Methylopila turkensis]